MAKEIVKVLVLVVVFLFGVYVGVLLAKHTATSLGSIHTNAYFKCSDGEMHQIKIN